MTLEQMRAWLTLEGWIFYQGSGTDEVADGARNGTDALVVLAQDDISRHMIPGESDSWPDTDIRPWGEVPSRRVELFYNYLTGENHELPHTEPAVPPEH